MQAFENMRQKWRFTRLRVVSQVTGPELTIVIPTPDHPQHLTIR
jgi:hypothetical protein